MSFLEGFDNMNGFSNAMGTMSSLRANQQRAGMANQQTKIARQQRRDTNALRKELAEKAEQQSKDTNALRKEQAASTKEQAKTNKLLEQQRDLEKEKNRIAQDKLAAEAKERQDTLEFRNLLGQSNTLLSLMKSRIC